MPMYDYRCSTCDTEFELFQSFSDDALTKCPTKKSGNSPAGCTSSGRGKVAKVFSAPGITFKGSGFYKNDSRTGSSTSSSESSNGESKKESTKSDSTKSEAKKKESKSDSSVASKSSSSNAKSSTD